MISTFLKKIQKYIPLAYVFLVVIAIYHIIFGRRIIPGVEIGDVYVGGKTYDEALSALNMRSNSIPDDLKLTYKGTTYILNRKDLSIDYNFEASVMRAFEVGRSGNIFIDTKDKLAGLVKRLVIGSFFDYDDIMMSSKLSGIMAQVSVAAKDSGVNMVDDKLVVTKSTDGISVIDDKLHELVMQSFANFSYSPKEIPVKVVTPRISEEQMYKLLPNIQKIVSKDITLTYKDKKWTLTKPQLLDILAFSSDANPTLKVNQAKLNALASSLASEIEDLPRGQVTKTDGDRVVEFKLTTDGTEIDSDAFATDFRQAYFGDSSTVEIKTKNISGPGDVQKYGIFSLLGEGTSMYKHSIPGRVKNLSLAAERTNGVLVAPGGVYSMNKSIGEISKKTGYDVAYIIQNGRTVLGEGGGVCQVSTTLFRAVLNAGLPVVMRYPHAYRVGYYEQDSKPGIDASIFQPSVDFQFRNDTPNYVLVQTTVDTANWALKFDIYGTPDGRKSVITEPVITSQTPPPDPLYQDDPTLPKGITQQVDFAAWGAHVYFTRTVTRGDKVIYDDKFTSNYQPWRAVYLVGTK